MGTARLLAITSAKTIVLGKTYHQRRAFPVVDYREAQGSAATCDSSLTAVEPPISGDYRLDPAEVH
jgi:hypothetical protein